MKNHCPNTSRRLCAVFAALWLAACGADAPDVPAPDARAAQEIVFPAPPAPDASGRTQAVAYASSGLPVVYESRTPQVCEVDAGSGWVQMRAQGVCLILARQGGDEQFRPAQAEQEIRADAPAPAPAAGVRRYTVQAVFFEPDTQPFNTLFIGAFERDERTGEIRNLRGALSQSMTGQANGTGAWEEMSHVVLTHPLSVVTDEAAGGTLVTVFRLPTTNTLSASPRDGGTDGWTPGSGRGLYYGYDGGARSQPNAGNAYVRIFVPRDALAPLDARQLARIAYADCTPEGMMGDVCMTGTDAAFYGVSGSMGGYPVAQRIAPDVSGANGVSPTTGG